MELINCSGLTGTFLGRLRNVQNLNLSYCVNLSESNIELLISQKCLQIAVFSGTKISNSNVIGIIQKMPFLKKIYLGGCNNLTNNLLDFVLELKSLKLGIFELNQIENLDQDSNFCSINHPELFNVCKMMPKSWFRSNLGVIQN